MPLIVPILRGAPLIPVSPGTTGLISWWELEELSGTRNDAHSNAYHLTDNNTVTSGMGWDPGGLSPNAAEFVAANVEYLSRADNANLSGGTGVRLWVGAWVYLNSTGTTRTILSKGTGAGTEYLLDYYAGGGGFRFAIADPTPAITIATVAYSPSLSTWYFIQGWYDGANLFCSVNNGVPGTAAFTANVWDTAGDFLIGARADALSAAFCMDGRVDGCFLYKRAPTAAERAYVYAAGAGRLYSGL